MSARILEVEPARHAAHALHRDERNWPETNCYVDLWIELLHALGHEPIAAMAFTIALDYEGDQFTFFKFPLEDLFELFGLDAMELQVWRPLPEAIETQLLRGRPAIVELDAFHLPDTRGVSYALEHVKTSVAVGAIDRAARRLSYFHNRGYHALEGADWAGVFREGAPPDPAILPPYFEVVKRDGERKRPAAELASIAVRQLRRHLARRPRQNPVYAFAADIGRDLVWLREQPLSGFHAWSFATLRQLGADAECAASFLRWLDLSGEGGHEPAAARREGIAGAAKGLEFKLARFASTGKPFDPGPSLEELAASWATAMEHLVARHGG
jgi:hypothetical protein